MKPANCQLANPKQPWHPFTNPYRPETGPVFCFLDEYRPWLLKTPHHKGRQGPWRFPQGRIIAFGPAHWASYIDMHGQNKIHLRVVAYYNLHSYPGPLFRIAISPNSNYIYFPVGHWKDYIVPPPRPSKPARKYLPD